MAESKASVKHALRLRDSLVVVLALTTGAVDAVTFVRLGKVFSSVITGNLALLGIAAGQRDGSLAVSGGLALAGYGLGVLVSRAAIGEFPGDRIWPRETTVALTAELAVLTGFSVGWLTTGGHPASGPRMALVVVAAAAMGIQSSAVRRLGQMSSTYLTSTLTGILESLAVRKWPHEWQRSTGVLLALAVGAALGASAATTARSLAPVAILVPLAVVVACAAWSASLRLPKGHGDSGSPDGEAREQQDHGRQ